MEKINTLIIKSLKRILKYLEIKEISNENKEEDALNSLAPKILTSQEDLKRVEPYLSNLKKAIKTKGINNIALTGGYGSGKSTILETFKHHNDEFEYLNISLASFKDNKDNTKDEEFERKLEVSILQQIFYHVKPSKIPDSRFKRIVNLTRPRLVSQTLFLLLWVLSTIILFKFDYINKLNPTNWSAKYKIDFFAISLISVFLIGVGLFVKSIVRLFSNSKISKFNIKGEVELGEALDKSVFNQHLEEILYFFERTDFNVVIIEDVDRFNSTDIFTKLREINILINNSLLIEREVKFVYAIKDEMFTDKNERVKFFEFIIPVIPFISPSNAGEQLTKLINAAKLQNVLSTEFTQDVITFIDDIDMRLLINIFQEYQLYKSTLNEHLKQEELFSVIVYKNMFPEDYGQLANRKGMMYKILSNKNTYTKNLIDKISQNISSIDSQINTIESEIDKPIKELRAVYIHMLISKLDGFHNFIINGNNVTITSALEESNFKLLRKADTINYNKFSRNIYNGHYNLNASNNDAIKFSTIEKEISSLSYEQREKNLTDKFNNQVNKLKTERERLQAKIAEIESLSIKEIFEQVSIDDYLLEPFKGSSLIRNLLLNGYINENYGDYISIFHGVNLTNEDFAFIRNVKSGTQTSFDYQLTKTDNIIKELHEKYFKRDGILNYSVLDTLLQDTKKHLNKFENYFKLLGVDNERNFQFILGFIERNTEELPDFIVNLVRYKPTLWSYLINKSQLSDDRIKQILKLIFEHATYAEVAKLENLNSLKLYLEEITDFIKYSSSFKQTKTLKDFIAKHEISFLELDLPDEETNNMFGHIYDNNSYQININNIASIIKVYKKEADTESLHSSHYSSLKALNMPKLLDYISEFIGAYIENVMLKLPDNNNEAEEVIIELLNNEEVSNELKDSIVKSQFNQIKLLSDIVDITVKEIVLKNNKIKPTWENIFDYYDNLEDKELNELLIEYLNLGDNYSILSKTKINVVKESDEEFVKAFSLKLIYCMALSIEAYTHLLKSIPYEWNSLSFDKIAVNRIEWMIINKFVKLNIENYDGIKEASNGLQIKLLEVNENEFIEQFDQFSLTASDWHLLFKSATFSHKGKIDIIKNLEPSIIIDNKNIADTVCYLLPKEDKIPLSFAVLEAIFKANFNTEKRVQLLNMHFDSLNANQIESLVTLLGGEYPELFIKKKRPPFSINDYNKKLFENLEKRNLISSYEIKEDKNEIRVVANYKD